MNSDYAKELLRTGIVEAKSGNKSSARRYLDRAIYLSGSYEVMAEAWFWMSEVLDEPAEKRKALENCLANDMHHARARRSLAILDGRLKSDDVINPDRLPATPGEMREAQADRFMCPKCGGRMSFAPDGQSLVCDYCTRGNALGLGKKDEEEKDFIVAMATMKGHGKPLQEQAFHCNGCGAEFILPPRQISATCAYCDSPHVVSLESTKDLLAPDSILPHAFDQKRATKLLVEWVKNNEIKPEKKVELPRGLYLPIWTFDIGGEIDYTGEMVVYEQPPFGRHPERKVVRVNDKYPVLVNDLPLPASRKLSGVFLKLISTFDLDQLKPYDPRYLVNWLAEIYDISMGDASLDARSQALKQVKKQMPALLNDMTIIRSSSAGLVVESFKLAMLPVWMTELPFGGREHLVLINGQNGVVASDLTENSEEHGGLLGFLEDLLGE
ncbi:MAG TPA: hypothetical protein PK078_13085 [Anaerolineales bacterium]|nr:hypothetical protein [Anaerolineales bacterium]